MCTFAKLWPSPLPIPVWLWTWLSINRMLLFSTHFPTTVLYPIASLSFSVLLSGCPSVSPSVSLPSSGLTPALACAPSKEVAECLALILATMMPFCSPCSSDAPSPGTLLRSLPHQAQDPPAPLSPRDPSGPSSEGAENDSDLETFWPLPFLESSSFSPLEFSQHLNKWTCQKLYEYPLLLRVEQIEIIEGWSILRLDTWVRLVSWWSWELSSVSTILAVPIGVGCRCKVKKKKKHRYINIVVLKSSLAWKA